jgi:hypothetical protein
MIEGDTVRHWGRRRRGRMSHLELRLLGQMMRRHHRVLGWGVRMDSSGTLLLTPLLLLAVHVLLAVEVLRTLVFVRTTAVLFPS